MAFLFAILMWGIVYQGYNAVFPSFYQELFPTKTRVTAFAVVAEPGHPGHRLPAGDLRRPGRPDPQCLRGGQEVPAGGRLFVNGRPAVPTGRFHRDRSVVKITVGSITLALAIIATISSVQCPGDLPGAHERSGQQGRRSGAQGLSTNGSERTGVQFKAVFTLLS